MSVLVTVCEALAREAAAALGPEIALDTVLHTFPADCGHPPLDDRALARIISGAGEVKCGVVCGCACCVRLAGRQDGPTPLTVHRLPQCSHLVAPPSLITGHLAEDAYLITSGWLAGWRDHVSRLGLDKATAPFLIGEAARRVVLLDTGVSPSSAEDLAEFARLVGLPAETVPVGLDYTRQFLGRAVFESLLQAERGGEALHRCGGQDQYRSLFSEMTEGFAIHEIITDDEGHPRDYRFLDVNPAFERLTGLKRADIIGRRVLDILPGTERHWIETYGKVALTGEPAHIENHSAALGRWYDVVAYRPAPRQFATVFMDITRRKATEEAVRKAKDGLEERVKKRTAELEQINRALEQEMDQRRGAEELANAERQRFNEVLETLPAYVVLLTPDYHVPFANRFFRERFGESNGRPCFEYLFGRTEPCEICETYTALKTKSPHRWEWTGPDGRSYDVFDYPFTDTDGSLLILEMGIDISDRKRAEDELRLHKEHLEDLVKQRTAQIETRSAQLAAEIAERKRMEAETVRLASFPKLNPHPVVEIDLEGRVCYANPAAQRLFPDLEQRGINHPWLTDWPSLADICGAGKGFTTRDVKVGEHYYHQAVSYVPRVQRIRIYALDITTAKRTEEALRESRNDLNRAQAVARTGSWRLDMHRNELLWSDETYRIFGIPLGTPLTYEVFLSAVHPADRDQVDQRWQAALQGEEPYDIEHRIVVDGEPKWVREQAELEFDAQGALLGGFGTVQDITESKRSRDALRASEQRYRSLAENLPSILMRYDRQLRVVYLSPNSEKITGIDVDRFLGKTNREVGMPEALCDQWEAAVEQVFRTGLPQTLEFDFQSVAGPRTFYLKLAPERGPDGEIEHVLGISTEITERKQAERQLRQTRDYLDSLFTYANAPIVVWDPQLRITRFNHAFERLTGRAADDVLGKGIDLLFPEAMREQSMATIRRTTGGERWEIVEIAIQHVDGSVRTVLWNSATVFDSDGTTPVATIAQGQDVTERKQAEEALRAGEDRLRVLNESLERRVEERTAEVRDLAEQLRALAVDLSQAEQQERKRLAKVLHDHIQQLLVAARMQLEWIKRSDGSERFESAVHDIDAILKEAIDASRSLTVELSPPVLHEAGLIAALNWLAAKTTEKNPFVVEVRSDRRAEPATEEVRVLLFECVRELLFNALKHSGAPRAVVTAVRTRDNHIRIVVEDEGRGFDPETLRIRTSSAATFGLFSVRERLAHIGGVLQIETSPGKGTRATLLVPVGKEKPAREAEEAAIATDEEAGPTRSRRTAGKIRVLIVDDHKIMREGLTGLLQLESDVDVVGEAADGPQAVELARKLQPNVIIMDVNLGTGKMSGVEATRLILSRHPHIRILGLSMQTDSDIAAAMREAGATAYFTKGGPAEDLVDAIRACRGR
ncbi:MAG: PAS domain S-box protein [Verrucomicrobia bacterium]|nr:PAS domain S-box protein [Verrucomicrobiota bacterium]